MKKIIVLAIVMGLFIVFLVFGFLNSYSNITGMYPRFSSKSFKPSKPFSKDTYSYKRYSDQVKEYIEDAKSYINAANNDIATINQSINEAINDANNIVEEYNRFINYGY